MKPTLPLKRSTETAGTEAVPKGGLRLVRGGAQAGGKTGRAQGETVAGRLQPYAAGARQAAARTTDAWGRFEPRLEQVAGTAAQKVREDVAPRVSSAVATAAERSAPAREEALERGSAAARALKGDLPVKEKRRWPLATLLFLVGVAAGAAGAVLGQRFAESGALFAEDGRDPESSRRRGPGAERDAPPRRPQPPPM